MQLTQVKLQDIEIVDNLSRAGDDHTEEEIRSLAEKIIVNQFWDPPDVRKNRNRIELIAGHLRIAAATYLDSEGRLPTVAGDKKGVWVLIHEKTDAARDALNAAENIVKKNLSTYQTAHTLHELQIRHSLDNRELAKRFGLDRKTIANYIRAARDLIPEIQHAWLNFDRSQHPIALMKLLTWAGLPPDEQLRQFDVSKWGKIYRMRDEAAERQSLRSRREIETALKNSTDLTVLITLEWVLRKRDNLNGESNVRSSRNDSGRRNRNERNPAGSSAPNGHGGGGAIDSSSQLMRPEQRRSPSRGTSASEAASNRESGPYATGVANLDSDPMASDDSRPPGTNRYSRRE